MSIPARKRCAIYTRKSSDERLDQDFNSLDAQRESCGAYILSQAGEGWEKIEEQYDDGGWSGGTMDRPGLQQLLEDVRAGKAIEPVCNYSRKHLHRLVRISWLAPDIISAILDGRQPVQLTARHLTRCAEIPMDWEQQRTFLGFG